MPKGVGHRPLAEQVYVSIGRVLRPHGLRGEIRIEPFTAKKENFFVYTKIFLAAPDDTKKREYRVNQAKLSGTAMVLKLDGCDNRNEAESLQGQEIWLDSRDLPPLPVGEFYLHTLMGKEAHTHDGVVLGRIVELLDTDAHALLVVHGGGNEYLIPAVSTFITAVHAESVVFTLPQGLLEINANEKT